MNDEIRAQVSELAEIMKDKGRATDADLLRIAQKSISIFHDLNFGTAIPKYQQLMRSLFLDAAVDLAHGAPLLKQHSLGITFRNASLVRFCIPYSESVTLGTVVCSIKIKSMKAFEKHLTEESSSLSQEQVNAAVYLLSFKISRL